MLAAALPASAQFAMADRTFQNQCGTALRVADDPVGAEVYVLKQGSSGSYTDWVWEVSAKPGPSTDAAISLTGVNITVEPNHRASQSPSDVYYIYVTLPPDASGAGRMITDNDTPARSSGAMGSATVQVVGARMGWTASPTAPSAIGTPGNTSGAGGVVGLNAVFGTIAETNTTLPNPANLSCTVGGAVTDPTNPLTTLAGIKGYNVFRIPGTLAAPPAGPAAFSVPGAFQYYVPLDSFTPVADQGGLTMPTRPATAPSDTRPNDLAGIQNLDGAFYTGDESLVFQDTGNQPDGTPRPAAAGAPPMINGGYWYAVQPVVGMGTIDVSTAFNGIGFTNNPTTTFFGNHVIMVNGYQAIDLNLDGNMEFYNPNAALGVQGLGLTNKSLPLLSAPFFGDTAMAALPAGEQVTFTADVSGQVVNISFSLGLEGSNVRGFNVFRLGGGDRQKINEQLIAAQGGEGSVYSVVDSAYASSRRVRRDAAAQYELEIVYDGAPSRVVGPFQVTTSGRETGRRTR
jgi:hypothetical protein